MVIEITLPFPTDYFAQSLLQINCNQPQKTPLSNLGQSDVEFESSLLYDGWRDDAVRSMRSVCLAS